MARDRDGGKSVSLEPEDKISVGLFGPGPALVRESVFAEYNYGGKSRSIPVWLITYGRDEETYEQPYSIGQGWRIAADGESLIPKSGQTGLPDSCNAILYLLQPLREAGFPKGKLGNNPRVLEGMEVVLERVPQEARPGLGDDRKDSRGEKRQSTILVIKDITKLPWESKGKGKGKKREEEEEEEAPRKSKRPSKDDEDDDDIPFDKGKKKGKGKSDDEEIAEAGVEAMIELLEDTKDEVDTDDLEKLLTRQLKGNPDVDRIVTWCVENVSEEKGWVWNKKKGTVEIG